MSGLQKCSTVIVLAFTFAAVVPRKALAVEFAAPVAYAVCSPPSAAVVADINGDGKPDLAVLCGDNVSVLLGNGDGTFQAAKNYATGLNGSAVAVGDFNADGKADLAVFQPGDASTSTAGAVSVLLGNGDGSFQAGKLTTLTMSAARLVAGDFNGDKKWDVVVSSSDTRTGSVSLALLIGKGDGTFQAPKAILSGIQSANFAVADFDNDGKLDLAIPIAGGVQVLQGRGDGTFEPGGTASVSNGFTSQTILTGDFNHDGNVDLVVDSRGGDSCNGSTCTEKQNVSVFLGHGGLSFGAEQVFAQGVHSHSPFGFNVDTELDDIVVGDFNGDDKLDIAVHQPFGNYLEVWLGRGDGTFASAGTSEHAMNIASSADLNADKLADIVVLDSPNNAVLVILNTSSSSGADLAIRGSSGPAANGDVNLSSDIAQGAGLIYTADVLNAGPQDATNVTFTDILPSSVTFVSATSSKGTCTRSNFTVTCVIGALSSAAETQIELAVTPTATGTITNTMNVTATEPDLVLSNNSATQTNTVVPVYTVTVTKSGNGTGDVTSSYNASTGSGGQIDCGTTCSAAFLGGTQVTIGAETDGKNFLTSWSGACSGNGSCLITVDGNKSVIANFVAASTLTVTVSGAGTGTVTDLTAGGSTNIICSNTQGTCIGYYFPGTTTALIASPSGNSSFGGWSGACSGMDPKKCSVSLSTSQTVTATFNPPPDFKVAPSLTNLTLRRGGKASETLSFSAEGGFSAAIRLACSVSGPAPAPTCGISPDSVNPGSNATLTVDASALSVGALPSVPYVPFRIPVVGTLCVGLLVLAFVITAALDQQRHHIWSLATLALVLSVIPAGCGGGSSGPPLPKNYSLTVTATSGTIQHSTTISVTVN